MFVVENYNEIRIRSVNTEWNIPPYMELLTGHLIPQSSLEKDEDFKRVKNIYNFFESDVNIGGQINRGKLGGKSWIRDIKHLRDPVG